MATKVELLARISELQATRDSMRTKIELQNEMERLEEQISKLESEIQWREAAFLNDSSQRADLLLAMDEIINEVGSEFREPPSPELRLRRNLAEHDVWEAADKEVMARPYEKPGWDREWSIDSWEHWMVTSPTWPGGADQAQALWEWLNDEEAQERSRRSQDWHREAAKLGDVTDRERQAELMASGRMPNWETDEPPPLTAEQRTVFDKHVASGVCWPHSRALDELLGRPKAVGAWGGKQEWPRCYASKHGKTEDAGDWCGSCKPGDSA